MAESTMQEKIDYAQTIINVLQTRLNESIGQNIQLEAKLIRLQEQAKEKEPELELTDAGEN